MAQAVEQSDLSSPTDIATAWLREFGSAFARGDAEAVARTFLADGWLRDSLTFTWDIRSLHGREKISSFLGDALPSTPVSNVRLSDDPYFRPTFHEQPHKTVEFGYTYETPLAWGRGYTRLVRTEYGRWEALTASTIVSDLKGHEEPPSGTDWEAMAKDRTWGDLQADLRAQSETAPHVLIGAR